MTTEPGLLQELWLPIEKDLSAYMTETRGQDGREAHVRSLLLELAEVAFVASRGGKSGAWERAYLLAKRASSSAQVSSDIDRRMYEAELVSWVLGLRHIVLPAAHKELQETLLRDVDLQTPQAQELRDRLWSAVLGDVTLPELVGKGSRSPRSAGDYWALEAVHHALESMQPQVMLQAIDRCRAVLDEETVGPELVWGWVLCASLAWSMWRLVPQPQRWVVGGPMRVCVDYLVPEVACEEHDTIADWMVREHAAGITHGSTLSALWQKDSGPAPPWRAYLVPAGEKLAHTLDAPQPSRQIAARRHRQRQSLDEDPE